MKETLVQLRARAEPGPALPPLPPGLAKRRLAHQGLARVRPPIRVPLLKVVVLQIPPQTLLEFLEGGEVAPPQELPGQDAEEQLHLVQPGAMHGQVVEDVLV